MELKGKKIGIAFCGSFCTFDKVFHELEHLKETGAEIYPVFSDAAKGIESRFGKPADFIKKAEEIAGRKPILCIEEAEPIGPKGYLDLLAITVSNPRHEIIIKYIAHTAKETYFLTASAKVQRMLGSQHMFVQYQISPIRIWIVIGIAAISKPSDFFIRISLIFSS